MKRRTLLAATAASGLAAMPFGAMAQAYPSKPITVVVPFAAGGPTDALARILCQRMGEALGQLYVAEAFPPEAKEKALALVKNVRATLRERLPRMVSIGPRRAGLVPSAR